MSYNLIILANFPWKSLWASHYSKSFTYITHDAVLTRIICVLGSLSWVLETVLHKVHSLKISTQKSPAPTTTNIWPTGCFKFPPESQFSNYLKQTKNSKPMKLSYLIMYIFLTKDTNCGQPKDSNTRQGLKRFQPPHNGCLTLPAHGFVNSRKLLVLGIISGISLHKHRWLDSWLPWMSLAPSPLYTSGDQNSKPQLC